MARSPESSAASNIESKLLSLPVEVHELIRNEILHNSSFITREVVLRNKRQLNSHKFNYRADTLRPLIHSCRALRAAYISAYYEHVEVCIVRVGQVWFKHLAERLEMVARHIMDPHIRQLVPQIRVMTVCLTQHNHESIIPLFASCLHSLPNLHTLQLMFVQEHQEMLATLRGAFEGQKYPQIKTIVLPGCAHWVLRACPDVIDVACNDWRNTELLEAIDIQCRQVEVVTGIDIRAHQSSLFRRALPNLRDVTFLGVYGHILRELTGMRNLAVIRIILGLHKPARYPDLRYNLENSIKLVERQGGHLEEARAVLAKSNAPGPKFVEITWQLLGSRDDNHRALTSEERIVLGTKVYDA